MIFELQRLKIALWFFDKKLFKIGTAFLTREECRELEVDLAKAMAKKY